MISHLGQQMGIADGIGLAEKLTDTGKTTLVFSGDGASSEGDFHEALNVAAVWDLPVIFVVENNGYGLSTPSNQQFRFKSFTEKGPGYGIEAIKIDGNNILEVYNEISRIARKVRKSKKPVLVEAITFRMRGHEEASGTKYVPKELMEQWAEKDPIKNYEKYLVNKKHADNEVIEKIRNEIKEEIEEGLKIAFSKPLPDANGSGETSDVFFPYDQKLQNPNSIEKKEMRFIDAISDALHLSMQRFPELVLMGQDIADYGGVFKITEGFIQKYGKERVRNTPLCESAILGVALGLSVKGQKSMVEMQFADFVTCGFNQIVNNLAKIHYHIFE
jgi:2-oxoisovalerate dehydrogenase E1 component